MSQHKQGSDTGLLNLQWAQALADGLAGAGVAELVLSPGSRSTPLALAFLRQPSIRCHVVLDERSAAFFALGLAKATSRTVALLCTSGSAPANWLPAVVEADLGAVPLLLLSADRPPELQGWGANQTVAQDGMYANHVRAAHAPGAPFTGFSERWLHRLAARAVEESRWPLPGPVHLNLPFREPLLPAAAASQWPLPQALPGCLPTRPQLQPDPAAILQIAESLAGRPGAIVCGGADGNGFSPAFAETLIALARKLDCPLLAEPLSGLRFGFPEDDPPCVRYDSYLRRTEFLSTHRPQWLLRFGAFPVTRSLQAWMADPEIEQIVIDGSGRWRDPQHTLGTLLRADPQRAASALLDAVAPGALPAWREGFARAEREAAALAESYREVENFEGALIQRVLERLPAGYQVFCGNSMAIRDLDAFSGSGAKPLDIRGNRGASGIDGNIATAAGLAEHGPTLALLGDLSCAHDIGSLACAQGRDLILLVINNGGGGIFEYLPQAALPEFECAWLTPAAIDFASAAQAWGLTYRRADTLASTISALDEALGTGGPRLIEVTIDRAASVAAHRTYWGGELP